MNKVLLIILISFVVFISGCTQQGQLSLNQTLSNIGQVNSFLSQYPNSTIQSVLLSNPPQNLDNQICGTNLTLSNVYFVNITNPQQNLLLLLNTSNNQMQCITATTAPALQQPANNTANINIGLSQGNLTGFISLGNTTIQVQTNIGSNVTTGLNTTVQTNLTGISSVSTNVTGGNLSIILQQGNLTQTIPTNITILNVTQAQQSNITNPTNITQPSNVTIQTNQTIGSQSNVTSPTNATNQTAGTNTTTSGNTTTQSNQTTSGNQTI